jgi:hypothetical protein
MEETKSPRADLGAGVRGRRPILVGRIARRRVGDPRSGRALLALIRLTALVVYRIFISAPSPGRHASAGLAHRGRGRFSALVARPPAEQVAAVGDKLRAGREAGLV